MMMPWKQCKILTAVHHSKMFQHVYLCSLYLLAYSLTGLVRIACLQMMAPITIPRWPRKWKPLHWRVPLEWKLQADHDDGSTGSKWIVDSSRLHCVILRLIRENFVEKKNSQAREFWSFHLQKHIGLGAAPTMSLSNRRVGFGFFVRTDLWGFMLYPPEV